MTYCHFYTLQNGQYYKWKTWIIRHIKIIATTFFTLKFILFDLGLRKFIYTCWLFMLLSLWYFFWVKPFITFKAFWIKLKINNWFKVRFNFWQFCHFYTLENDLFGQHYKRKQYRTQSKIAIYSRSSVQNFDNWTFWIRKNKSID